ncbi:cation:proton antiporter [Candidatus Gottesmanbacteria bacterium]|nr:cation:proton antiporter [Candidatus Gottesmanbacteria bacterium]
MEVSFSYDLVVILFTSFVGGVVAKKLKLPVIVGYAVSGIFVGSILNQYIPLTKSINSIAEIGVALLLFTVGLEFTVNRLKELGEVIFWGSLIQVLFTILIGLIIFPLFGMDFYTALFLGAVFSLSSTAAVLKVLSDRGELETLHGEMAAGWLFMQDLYTLPLFILLPAIGSIMLGEQSQIFVSTITFGRSILIATMAFFVVLLLGKRTVPWIFGKIANLGSRELLLTAAVGMCLFLAYLFQLLGLSYALGAFVAGILLASSTAHHGIFAEVRPLRDLFATVFFVSLGFLVRPEFFLANWVLILLLTTCVIGIKFFVSTILVILLGYHTKTAVLVGFSLVSVGEFAFILAILGNSARLITNDTFLLILSVTFFSLIVSIPLLSVSDRLYYFLKRIVLTFFPFAKTLVSHLDISPPRESFTMENHVVVLGHGRVGKYICKALASAQIPYVVVDYNHVLVDQLKKSGVTVIYGDPAEIDVLEFARVREARVVILAYADRHTQEAVITNTLTLNPSAIIICRTHFEEDAKKLKSLGVHTVVQPEFEAAISMTQILLQILGEEESTVREKVMRIRTS